MLRKYFNLFLVAFLVCLSLSDCEEEKAQPRDYPRVRTLPVSNITAEGATFKADLYSLGTENIKEYGFVWGPNIDPGLESDKVVFPGSNAAIGVYTSEIKSTLIEGTEYTVKSFVKTDSHVIYGTPLTFVSLGSLAPVITAFSPETVFWGDTLTIRGRNFSWIAAKNIVRLNQTECQVIASSDTVLLAIVKSTLSDAKVKISVELTGNTAIFDKKDLIIKVPEITGFFPSKAKWHDTLTITGKNMIAGYNKYTAKIGDQICDIYMRNKDTLAVIVSSELVNPSNDLKITINDSELIVPDPFTLILPEITGISPQGARWGDTIIISGTDFMISRNRFTLAIGELSGVFIKYGENAIKAVVPLNLKEITNEVKIRINNLELKSQKPFELLSPEISGISPEEGTWHEILTIRGHFHPLAEQNTITIGGWGTEILANTRDSIKVKVPADLSFHNNPVVIATGPFTVTSQYSFKLFPPSLKSVSPLTGHAYSTVTIRGKYFFKDDTYSNHVYFGTQEAWIESANDSVIVCNVRPGIGNGPVKITVKVGEQSTVFTDNFIGVAPVITRIFPLNGFYNDAITIEGKNFLVSVNQIEVYFENYDRSWYASVAKIQSISDNRIVALVPEGLDSIPKIIVVNCDERLEFEQLFVLDPPQITSVSPSSLISGQLLTITGKNFNPSAAHNKVFWGIHQIPVISSTTTQIVAVPQGMSRGINKISIKTAGYKRSYPAIFEVKSKWSEITLPESFNWNSYDFFGGNGNAFSTANICYMLDGVDGQMTSYNPATGEFMDLGKHPQFGGSYMRTGVVCMDTLYLLGKSGAISRFDNNSKTWIDIIKTVPSEIVHGVALSINDKIYRGLDFTMYSDTLDNKFWIFDPKQKTWLSKKDFPGYSGKLPVEYFVIGNKGYVLFADKIFCEYDPVSDKWNQLPSFPGPGLNRVSMVSFVIDNKAYVGLGRDLSSYQGYKYDDFWTFNPQTGTWSESTFMPWGPRYNALSFVVNNKAYVGFGYKSEIKQGYLLDLQQRDLYEFDPYYPVK